MDDISYGSVLSAADRLFGHAVKTPLIESETLNAIAGRRVLCKDETAQHTGSFKYRGAYNRLSQLSVNEREGGVVAFSSGNHAQGVSRAAKELGISAIIVMPLDAPQVKVDGVLSDGAHIVSYDRMTESRESIAALIATRDGRVIVPSFDDAHIISGQGTTGLEIATQAADMGASLDGVIICIGGGGLCAGSSLAIEALSPRTKFYGAEPAYYDDHKRSLASGKRERNNGYEASLCDALMTPSPGELTWAINGPRLSGVYEVTDEECLLTMALAQRHLGVTLEPGGAAALTVALSGRLPAHLKTVAVTLSGGNVDPAVFARAQAYI